MCCKLQLYVQAEQRHQQCSLTNLCLAMSIFPSNTSDTTATSKLAPHLQENNNRSCSIYIYTFKTTHELC
jgi:hypothetical protein